MKLGERQVAFEIIKAEVHKECASMFKALEKIKNSKDNAERVLVIVKEINTEMQRIAFFNQQGGSNVEQRVIIEALLDSLVTTIDSFVGEKKTGDDVYFHNIKKLAQGSLRKYIHRLAVRP